MIISSSPSESPVPVVQSRGITMATRLRQYLLIWFCMFLAWPGLSVPAQTRASRPAPAKSAGSPKLILLIVVDQFRPDYLTRFGDLFGAGGFRRLLNQGAYFTSSHYLHACTYTACGHSVLLSGSIPAITGIIGNEWVDRESGFKVTSVSDADYVGVPEGRGASPRKMMSTTLGDQLRLQNNFRSRAIGISLKDRSAILPAGKSANAAYWFDTAKGQMQTSSYYLPQLPDWVKTFNDQKIPTSYFGKTWDRVLPESEYARSDQDNAPYETGLSGVKTFPHVVNGGGTQAGPKFYDDFTRTPWANDYLVDFAELAIENEKLGQDEYTDVLSVSFSANDIMGHAFGPYSQEMQDMVIRTDRTLERFFQIIDQRVGLTNTLVVFSADHGVAPVPEYAQAKKLGGGRVSKKALYEIISQTLNGKYGEAPWIAGSSNESIYLNQEVIKSKGLNRSEVERVAGEAAMNIQGVATYFTRTQLINGPQPASDLSQRVAAAFNPQRSGDVYLIAQPYFFFEEDYFLATTHGSPYSYDTHVPVILMGKELRPGQYPAPSSPADIAPTLAAILGIEPPSGSVGRVLTEALEPAVAPTKKKK